MKKLLSLLLVPFLLLYRYRRSKAEIAKVKGVNSTLGSKHLDHCQLLVDREELLRRMPKECVCAEVGVAAGDFSARILEICKPEKLHLIDYWKDNRGASGFSPTNLHNRLKGEFSASPWKTVNNRFSAEISNKTVELNRGFSWDMLSMFPEETFDFIYIDAAHDYESVKKDMESAARVLKPGGVLCGHDYIRWGQFGVKCGVVEAVNEFCITNQYEFIFLTAETKNVPSFAIRKMA